MDNELFELCKEVSVATDWDDVRDFFHENDSADYSDMSFKRNGTYTVVERRRAHYDIPLYTSDYLLEKLKHFTVTLMLLGDTVLADVFKNKGENVWVGKSDTPLKALLRLTLALHEAGELK